APKRGVRVLHHIDAIACDRGIQFLERSDLLIGRVPAIVEHNVRVTDRPQDLLQEATVGLVADEDLGGNVLMPAGGRIDIDTVQPARWAEITAPHFQGSAALNADLQQSRACIPEPGQMALIGFEVVVPFVNRTLVAALNEEPVKVAHADYAESRCMIASGISKF